MPTFTFTSPEGKSYDITGPEGATQDQAFKILQQQMSAGTAKPGAPVTKPAAAPAESIDPMAEAMAGPGAMTEKGFEQGRALKESFSFDPSRVGSVPASEYIRRMLGGAAAGGAIGAGIGAFTGPGAVATGAAGAAMGGASGLIEAGLADLGFGTGYQTVGGMLAPSPGTVGKAATKVLGQAATDLATRGVTSAKDLVGEIAAHKMFGWGAYPVRRAMQAIEKGKPVETKALEQVTGVPAASRIQPGSVENVTKARQDIAQQYGLAATVEKPESAIYEAAKANYDNLIGKGMDFTRSQEFLNVISSYPEKSRKFMFETYADIFKKGGSLKPGDVVINDLKNLNLTPKQDKEIREAFNSYLQRTTGKPWEAEARKAAESVFVAQAKDQLPTLLLNSAKEVAASADARRILKSQIQNFSKTPETRKIFWEETTNALKNLNVADAKALWGSIGPEVRQWMIKDPATYQKITEIMSGAKTQKEISNAVRLIVKAGATKFASEE